MTEKTRSLTDLFHRVGRILPEEQELVTIGPSMSAQEALELMRRHNFSQIPIVAGTEVLGVFSYRSFSEGILRLCDKERDLAGLPVEVYAEDLKFAQISDELSSLLVEFDLRDAVLVGAESKLQGIVTSVDALCYFYEAASAYVMIREIELAIRELMRTSVDEEGLKACIDKCIRKHYEQKSQTIPTCLEEMSFSDYVQILQFKGFWDKFKGAFGGAYSVLQTRLAPLPELRNDVFHFRRELTVEDYDMLRDVRDWLLKRIRKIEAERKLGENE